VLLYNTMCAMFTMCNLLKFDDTVYYYVCYVLLCVSY
jgi:hypothetical protein